MQRHGEITYGVFAWSSGREKLWSSGVRVANRVRGSQKKSRRPLQRVARSALTLEEIGQQYLIAEEWLRVDLGGLRDAVEPAARGIDHRQPPGGGTVLGVDKAPAREQG